MYTIAVLYVSTLLSAASITPLPPVGELPRNESLPDPLVSLDGREIDTPEEWYGIRRPELKRLFQHYVYGYAPKPPGVSFNVDNVYDDILGGDATLKEVTISFPELGDDAPEIHLALFLPNDAEGPVPVFLALNKCGNHTILSDVRIAIDESAFRHPNCEGMNARGARTGFWNVDYLISRGYGFATYHESNIDADSPGATGGMQAEYNLKQPPDAQWGTLRAWAWGLSRCVDYLVTEAAVDSDRIAVTGHSRRGKAALLAAAMDERIAMANPHQSGTGGMALSRDNDQETVKSINENFPHWFNDNFRKFNDNVYKLPVDQHLLIALVAPRPLLETIGLQNTWVNYVSSLRAIRAADPVYKLLGSEGMAGDGVLSFEPITAENSGPLQQYRLNTGHTLNRDYWKAILDFADLYMTGKE